MGNEKFFVSKLKYDVIQKDGYFNVGSIGGRQGGVGGFCVLFVLVFFQWGCMTV